MKWKLFILFCISYLTGNAQQTIFTNLTSYEKRGDKMVYYFSYLAAVEDYKQALKIDPEKIHLQLKIAECYRMLNDPKNSEPWYAQAMTQQNLVKPEHRLHYAMALHSNGKFNEAQKWYKIYQNEVANDSRSERKIKGLEDIQSLFKDSITYKVTLAGVNSKEADFSPSYYQNGIVFVSSRVQRKAVKTVFSWNRSQFLDLYYAPESENGTYTNPTLFHSNVNTRLHEGPTTYFDNGTKMIFTRNNLMNGKQRESSDGVVKLKLYSSELMNGEWSSPVSLPFNNNEYSVGHPTITEDGNTLYFSSDKPGGIGGADIYKAEMVDGKWGEPVNLGPEINTEGNEMFPYIHPDNILFFASNGHGGLGGFDVFQATINDRTVKNLGAPFNSTFDDFGLVISHDRQSGFFSSNRTGGLGDDDIYHFQEKLEMVELIVFDKETGKTLEKVIVAIKAGSEAVVKYYTEASGSVVTILNPTKNYVADLSLAGYQPTTLSIEAQVLRVLNPLEIRVPMTQTRGEDVLLTPDLMLDTFRTVLHLEIDGSVKENIEESKKYEFKNLKKSIDFIRLVNSSEPVLDLLIDGTHTYLYDQSLGKMVDASGQINPIVKETLTADTTERKHNIINALTRAGLKINFYEIKNIYYDFNRWNIRNDASSDLDKIVRLLESAVDINLVLTSHTDSRSSLKYNEWLSGKRADAAQEYLRNEGVNPGRITNLTFGETKLVNQCTDGVTCDETNHQLNRRTEFIIKLKK